MRSAGLACLMVALGSTTARAESALPQCQYGTPEATPPAGSIPANWPSFAIALSGGGLIAESTRMTRMSDGHVVPLVFAARSGFSSPVAYAPMEALVVGETYVVDHPMCRPLAPRSAVYVVAAAIAAPASLGAIVVRGPFAANTQRGVCHRSYFVLVDLTPDAAFASAPWSTVHWDVAIDGATAYTLGLSITNHSVRLTLPCSETPGPLAEGMHTARGVAGPFSRPPRAEPAYVTFETASVSFTAFCRDAVRVDATTLAPLTTDQIATWDADVGTCGMDGATSMDAGSSFDGAAHTEPDTRPNCACGVARPGASPTFAFFFAALIASRCGAWRALRRARRTARS